MKPSDVVHAMFLAAEKVRFDKTIDDIASSPVSYQPTINVVLHTAFFATKGFCIEDIVAIILGRSNVNEDTILYRYGPSTVTRTRYFRANHKAYTVFLEKKNVISREYVHLLKAAYFASVRHVYQKRKSDNSPYINHPIGVANILGQAGVEDVNVLIAALLHDTVEDTGMTLQEIEKNFSTRVKDIVAGVTDDKSLPAAERKRLQIEHASTTTDEGVKMVKLADKIHNLQSFFDAGVPKGWPAKRVLGYFVWSREVTNGIHLKDENVNAVLKKSLDKLYGRRITIDGEEYDTVPENSKELLEEYYEML